MNDLHAFEDYIKAEKYRLSLGLGIFALDAVPLGSGMNGVVYKARLNDADVALKFFIFDGGIDKESRLKNFRKEFLTVSLLETRRNIVQYVDYDVLRVKDMDIPVLIMKLYKCSLEEWRSSLSASGFVKLFHFLTDTVQFLHSMGLTHRAIKPRNILVDDHNEFVLTDAAITCPAASSYSDISAIGEVLQWYVFGDVRTDALISSVFPGLVIYDQIVKRCLSADTKICFQSVGEILSYIEIQKERNSDELLEEFGLICRKNFPKELPEFVHCTDQKKIAKLFADFVSKREYFGNNLVYFTDVERNIFSPRPSKDGFYKFDKSIEFKILDVWIHSNDDKVNDYILVHHANTTPQKVNGKETFKWAVYEGKMLITWAEAMNGFAEIEGDIIPLDKTKIEFFNRSPREGYLFVALNRIHNLSHPNNLGTLRDYFFRFSFSYVNRYILEDMNNMTRHHMEHKK